MQKAVILVSVLVLGSVWTHTLPEPLPLPQEDFQLDRFMGRWLEVAVVSTCPHYMQRKRLNPVIVALQLEHAAPQSNFTMMATSVRNGSCHHTSTVYDLTSTPGRFFHHIVRFDADVDSYVVNTNYDDYAMMLLLSLEKQLAIKTTSIKLYSRTVDVSPAVLLNFTALVRQHGMSDEAIIMNQQKGECAPPQLITEP